MKYIIELGLTILLMAIAANNLPSIVRKVRLGQMVILKEASASNWGRVWVPQKNK
jgi:uncharacterized protein YegJ (DUF2314 family)